MAQEQRQDQSFRSLMDSRGAPEGQNPFFAAVPTFQFELYNTDCWPQPQDMFMAQKMARRFGSMLSKIKILVLEQTARENNGHAQYVEGVIIDAADSCPDFQLKFGPNYQRRNHVYLPQQIMIDNSSGQIPASPTGSVSYKIPTTSASGLFAVMVQPMGRKSRDEELIEPVKVIFSLTNLYALGFVYKEVFYHYDDADVSGIAVTEATKRFIAKIPMNGGYMGNDLKTVKISNDGLWQAHDTLSNAENRTRREVRQALMSIFVPISEGIRFLVWFRRLYEIYSNNLKEVTTDPEDKNLKEVTTDPENSNPEQGYSIDFQDWGTISYAVAHGQVNFSGPVGTSHYNTFEKLLMKISVLLLSEVKKADEKSEEQRLKALRREKEERKLKGKRKIL